MPSASRTVSVPNDLDALYREHEAQLPGVSSILQEGMRRALRKIGVEPPPPPPENRGTNGAEAARKARTERSAT